MKTVLTYALTGLAAFAAMTAEARTPAREAALDTAKELVHTLNYIEDEATYLADVSHSNHEAYAYTNLADSASALADKVKRQIIVPLYDDATFAYVKGQLARIQSNFNLLDYDAAEVNHLSYDIADALEEVDYLKYDLNAILAAGDRGRPGRPTRPSGGR